MLADTSEQSGAESAEESFKTSGFATMASTTPTVAGIAHSAISDTAAPTVNGGAVENGAEEESKREGEREKGWTLADSDGVSGYRAQRGAK